MFLLPLTFIHIFIGKCLIKLLDNCISCAVTVIVVSASRTLVLMKQFDCLCASNIVFIGNFHVLIDLLIFYMIFDLYGIFFTILSLKPSLFMITTIFLHLIHKQTQQNWIKIDHYSRIACKYEHASKWKLKQNRKSWLTMRDEKIIVHLTRYIFAAMYCCLFHTSMRTVWINFKLYCIEFCFLCYDALQGIWINF